MERENKRFEALFNFAAIGIIVANASGEIEMANDYLLTQFGYNSDEELLGKKIEVLIPQRYNHRHIKFREHYNDAPVPRIMGVGRDLFAKKKDGTEFPVEVSLSNYNDIEGSFVIAFVIDITLRKEIEIAMLHQKELLLINTRKIEELNNALEEKVAKRTSQLEVTMEQLKESRDEITKALTKEKELGDLKTRFVSMASHEFRTPLSTILSSASLLAKYKLSEEQDKRDKHINRIKDSVNNLTDILNDFLSIGKIEDGRIDIRKTQLNLPDLMQSISNEMQANAKNGQQISCQHIGAAVVTTDSSMLRNIVLNLLSNALKFTDERGEIKISTKVDNKKWSIAVADNGLGIPAADQPHLFERFYRAQNATNIQGTGLGLHIVHKYIEILGGNISFKSNLGDGTCFTINFIISE